MEFLPEACAAQSMGAANTLFGILIQALVQAQCSLTPPDRYPKDYGKTALEQGFNILCEKKELRN